MDEANRNSELGQPVKITTFTSDAKKARWLKEYNHCQLPIFEKDFPDERYFIEIP